MTPINEAFQLINHELAKRAQKVYDYLKKIVSTPDEDTTIIVHNVLYDGHVCQGKSWKAFSYMTEYLADMTQGLSCKRDATTIHDAWNFCNAEALMLEIITLMHDGSEGKMTKLIIF